MRALPPFFSSHKLARHKLRLHNPGVASGRIRDETRYKLIGSAKVAYYEVLDFHTGLGALLSLLRSFARVGERAMDIECHVVHRSGRIETTRTLDSQLSRITLCNRRVLEDDGGDDHGILGPKCH